LFLIPTQPQPTLTAPEKWSKEFNDFLKFVLVKNPNGRPSAIALLQHPFFKNVPGPEVIIPLVRKADEIVAARGYRIADSDSDSSGSDEESSEEDEYSSDEGEIDLKRLTIGAEDGKALAAQVRATLTAEQSDSDESSDEAPETVMFSNVSDFQSQLEVPVQILCWVKNGL
jgi:serine/threonine protein kinase